MNKEERIQRMLENYNAIRLYVRTYPRSGTHLIGSILHYKYGFSPMSPTFVKPTIKGQSDPLQYFTFHYNQQKVFLEQIPDIYVLRNPIDCIGSQYYRAVDCSGDFKEEDKLAYKNSKIPTDYKRPGFHCNTIFNEVGKYNEMLSCIRPNDLVLYYEDLFECPEKWLELLDVFLKNKYDVDRINLEMPIQEIMDITLEWYNKSGVGGGHRSLNTFSEKDQVKQKDIKEKMKPYIYKFINNTNKYVERYKLN
jgi:hypothetical protein